MEQRIGRLFGSGAGSDVYEYGDKKVCKLYKRDGGYSNNLDWEYNKLLDAYDNGLPAPRVYEKIFHEGRSGYIMDRIYGVSYLEIFFNHIGRSLEKGLSYADTFNSPIITENIQKMVTYLYNLHQYKCKLRISGKTSLTYGCMDNKYLTAAEKEKIISIIDALSDDDCVCHGDPHPGNFIVNNGTIQMIDWNDCVVSSPLYDIGYPLFCCKGNKLVLQ